MNLNELYSSINKNIIDNYIKNAQEENIFLDFKTVNNSEFTNKDDKKNLSKSLSGFANSSGGIIIWGVKANKNKNDIDCATELKLIENLYLFKSKINELTGRAVSPLVEGVLHKPIFYIDVKGILVTLVPESTSGPHMAKLGQDRYFKRSGDSFYRMEHFDIEDMFGRRKKPNLILRGFPIKERARENKILILLAIENIGRGIAKYPFLSIMLPNNCSTDSYGIDGNYSEGLPQLNRRNNYWGDLHFGAKSDIVIHPETIFDTVMINCPNSISEDILIPYKVGAEGIRISEGELRFAIDEINKVKE